MNNELNKLMLYGGINRGTIPTLNTVYSVNGRSIAHTVQIGYQYGTNYAIRSTSWSCYPISSYYLNSTNVLASVSSYATVVKEIIGYAPSLVDSNIYDNAVPIDYSEIQNFVVPTGCSSITVHAWGGGGGSGGRYSAGTPGQGGGGGYVGTTLTVGTDVQIGDTICCLPAFGGIGGTATWTGGGGGGASIVWVSKSGIQKNISEVTAATAVVVAGGGGGGGATNWSVSYSNHGGSGNSRNAGSGNYTSGTNAGATATDGAGKGSTAAPVDTNMYSPTDANVYNFTSPTTFSTRPAFHLAHLSIGFRILYGAAAQTSAYTLPSSGGGGVYAGACGDAVTNSNTAYGRGAGGGASGVFKGSSLGISANGITTGTTNAGPGNAGYGIGASSSGMTTSQGSNYYLGTCGTPGRITLQFT